MEWVLSILCIIIGAILGYYGWLNAEKEGKIWAILLLCSFSNALIFSGVVFIFNL